MDKNMYGFDIKASTMTTEEWLKQCVSGQEIKVIKVDGFIFLQNPLLNQVYLVSEPKKERLELHADGVKIIRE